MNAMELLRGALGLTNAVGVDQTLSADEITDSLRVLNDLIEDWSTQGLAVYGQANQTFSTVAAQATYTIGIGGNWATTRPVRINTPGYSTIQGVTFPCVEITRAEYDTITNKAQPRAYPDYYLYVNEYPLGLVTLWPVPDAVTPITFSIDRVITAVPTAATALSFPPGYTKAFKYALGVELAPMFGKSITSYPDVAAIAAITLGNIKRANTSQKKRVMMSDPAYSDSWHYGGGDWRSG